MAPGGIGTTAAMLVVGRLTGRVDVRILLTCWLCRGRVFKLADDAIRFNNHAKRGHRAFHHSRRGPGAGLCTPGYCRYLVARTARRRNGDLQFNAQHWQRDRHLRRAISAGSQHADCACRDNRENPATMATLSRAPLGAAFHLLSLTGAALLNAEITRQATMIGYLDDYRLMLIVTVIVIPHFPYVSCDS